MRSESVSSIDILGKLVGFDTTSYLSNLELIEYIADYLSSFNVSCSLIRGGVENKTNLFATIGKSNAPGIILSGHTDVVPVDDQNWASNPFVLKIQDGKAFGRGTCDMKGFLACVLAAVPKFVSAELVYPIHLAFSYDEEVGCVGVRHLVEEVSRRGLDIRACIVGEPSSMKPVTAHTGKQVYRCTFRGTAMHSSLAPKGVNAIAFAGETIHHINRIADCLADQIVDDPRFIFPFPTVNVGRIEGGKAVNIVAEACSFDVEYRYPPSASIEYFSDELSQLIEGKIRESMKRVNADADAFCERLVAYPAFQASATSKAVELVMRITGANDDLAVNYGTEAGIFEEYGFPTVVCGPGDIEQAHQSNEYIKLSQLDACDAFLTGLIRELSREEISG